jgi:hypothetical protein
MGEYTRMNFEVQCNDEAQNPLKLEIHPVALSASTQDKDKWQAVVSTVLNIQIPQKEAFLDK